MHEDMTQERSGGIVEVETKERPKKVKRGQAEDAEEVKRAKVECFCIDNWKLARFF
ncbi:hypothetical protein GVAV_002743 [Gurleya vavrai]